MDVLTRGARLDGPMFDECNTFGKEFLLRDLIEPGYIQSEKWSEELEDVQFRQKTTTLIMAGIVEAQEQDNFTIPTTPFDHRKTQHSETSEGSDRDSQISGSTLWEVPAFDLDRSTSKRSSSQSAPDNESTDTKNMKRARNAANCRHGKSSKHSSDRFQDQLRERNRMAAAKHRIKRRAITEGMSDDLRNMKSTNELLKRQCLELRNQLSYWRIHALQHISGEGGCQCNTIHQYNAKQACEIVLGVERGGMELAGLQTCETSFA